MAAFTAFMLPGVNFLPTSEREENTLQNQRTITNEYDPVQEKLIDFQKLNRSNTHRSF